MFSDSEARMCLNFTRIEKKPMIGLGTKYNLSISDITSFVVESCNILQKNKINMSSHKLPFTASFCGLTYISLGVLKEKRKNLKHVKNKSYLISGLVSPEEIQEGGGHH